MPRTPEVCPTTFCPLSRISNIGSSVLRILSSASHQLLPAFCPLPIAFCLLPSAFCLLLLIITHHSGLITVHAQGATATLSGAVTDQNDAVIPDVNIAVINIARGFQRSATTNGEGAFVVPLLPPGNYTVKAEHKGFTPTEVRDVVLNVNDQVAMKIHMSVGTLSQTVQIVEGSSLINESPAVATVVDRRLVENLPLNGRSFQSLITLSPGVLLTSTNSSEQGQFSVNGQRANANYFSVDGVGANIGVDGGAVLGQGGGGSLPRLSAAGGTNNLVSVDALQEFKIQTSTYAAEYGRTPGAQVQIITRSGTNDFHSTLFDYVRNDVFDANDWFANANRLPKPKERQNDFGGVIGGPILFPRFGEGGHQPWYNGRNRTFFFFSYEGLRLRQPLVGNSDVPSLRARATAVAGMKPFLNAFPLPTGPENLNPTTGLPTGFAPFAVSYSAPATLNATSIRIDHTLSSKLALFGRYNYSPSESLQRIVFGTSLNNVNAFATTTQTLTTGATLVLSSRASNELRANYSRTTAGNSFSLDSLGGAVVPSDSSIFPPFASSKDGEISINIFGGLNSVLRIGREASNLQRQINLVDNLSVLKSGHQLKFGVDYRRLNPLHGPQIYGQFANFNSVDDAVLGRASSVSIFAQRESREPVFTNLSLYGQDTWKVNRRLTLTYGLRWEFNPPPHERNGNDPFVATGIDNLVTITLAARGTPLYKATYNNFAPRVGAAYQLSQSKGLETVLRGGFGVFYDLGNGRGAGNAFSSGAFPYGSRKALPSGTLFPLTLDQAMPASFEGLTPQNSDVYAFPNLKLPYVYEWNLAVEQSFGANQTLTASYVAAISRRLLRTEDFFRPNPNFFQVFVTRNAATSDYQALQLEFQRRLSRGFQALASYTWSHSIDNISNDSSISNLPASLFSPSQDRGSSDFDVRHSISAGLTYDLPAPTVGVFGNAILRNWSIDGVITARSATPVDLIGRLVFSGFLSNVRPDFIPGVPFYLNDSTVGGGKRFNPSAFVAPPIDPVTRLPLRQGTLGRNVLRGFPISQFDFALRRQFSLTERFHLQLKMEAFNLFNHPNFGSPVNDLRFPQFGRSTAMFGRSLGGGGLNGGFNPLYQVGGPRSLQFSLKLQL
jgi:hypothetical protein